MQTLAGMQTKKRHGRPHLSGVKKQWVIAPVDKRSDSLARTLKISTLMAQVLINRGISDANSGSFFLKPRLSELISPEKMPGITQAVKRIRDAISNKEKITIYGDYDVDGITGISILWHLIKILGGDVDYYIPHRIDEGYGLNAEAVEFLIKSGSKLLITVDCGVTAINSAKLACELGLDLIITDHHQPNSHLPDVFAIVHPVMDEAYPNQDSSGAMVAFKLAWALANEFSTGRKLESDLRDFMINATSLAAIGTVADVVDLRGENRILTSFGLSSLAQCKLHGIQALIESAELAGKDLDSFDIGFRLAPMLNAAGRMGHARLAVELLTSDNEMRSMKIAEYLKQQNQQRRQYEQRIFKQACEIINERGLNHPDQKSIVLSDSNWHSGVIGIVASRIVDRYCRPTILINSSEKVAQGSARSIPGFCLLSAIQACSEHLTNFGGHKMAAGITIDVDKIEHFANDFEAYARENLNDQDIVLKIYIDAQVSLNQLNFEVVNQLQMLGPFGQGNPRPVFATKAVRLISPPRKVGAKSDHLQLAVTDNTASIRCIGFGMGKYEKKLLERDLFNVAYEPDINHFNGNSSVQLILNDIQFE